MVIDFIFGFGILFFVITVGYQIIYFYYVWRFKQKIGQCTLNFTNRRFIGIFCGLVYILAVPSSVALFVLYGLLKSNIVHNDAWAYVFITVGFVNYIVVISYVCFQNLWLNSFYIAVDQKNLYLLEATIPLEQIIGLQPEKMCFFIKYLAFDKLTEYKRMFGDQTFNFLKNI